MHRGVSSFAHNAFAAILVIFALFCVVGPRPYVTLRFVGPAQTHRAPRSNIYSRSIRSPIKLNINKHKTLPDFMRSVPIVEGRDYREFFVSFFLDYKHKILAKFLFLLLAL